MTTVDPQAIEWAPNPAAEARAEFSRQWHISRLEWAKRVDPKALKAYDAHRSETLTVKR